MFAASSSNARARFTDTFTVTCPDPAACGAGRLGKMTIGFLPGGTFDAVGKLVTNAPRTNGGWRGEAHWGADLNIQSMRTDGTAGFNFSFAGGQLINNDPTGTIIRGMNASYPYIDAAMQSLTFDFIFGAPVHINMSAITETYTSINYDSSGSVGDVLSQVGLRAGWGGVFSITDALGMTWNDFDSVAPARFATSFALMDLDGLADFTVRSELTGINYLNDLVTVATVPEPNSSLVALLGLAAIAAGVPRRRRLDRSASESRKDNQ
jgi:hypothetical protein